jgi:hypothetical protein
VGDVMVVAVVVVKVRRCIQTRVTAVPQNLPACIQAHRRRQAPDLRCTASSSLR